MDKKKGATRYHVSLQMHEAGNAYAWVNLLAGCLSASPPPTADPAGMKCVRAFDHELRRPRHARLRCTRLRPRTEAAAAALPLSRTLVTLPTASRSPLDGVCSVGARSPNARPFAFNPSAGALPQPARRQPPAAARASSPRHANPLHTRSLSRQTLLHPCSLRRLARVRARSRRCPSLPASAPRSLDCSTDLRSTRLDSTRLDLT